MMRKPTSTRPYKRREKRDRLQSMIGDRMKFGVVVEKDEDGYYVASVPELPGCHTQAKTLDKVMKRIKEAIQAYLETLSGTIPV